MRARNSKRQSRSRAWQNSPMRLPFTIATAGVDVLLSTIVFVVFCAFHGCWGALMRLVRGREIASHPLASPGGPKADAASAPRRSVVFSQTQTRFRSDVVVKRAGRFRFDGFVAPGRRSAPSGDEMFVNLAVGDRFSRVDFRACWWAPADVAVAESVAEERMSWEGGPAAPNKGKEV